MSKEKELVVTEEDNELMAMMSIPEGEEEQLTKDDLSIPMLKIAQKGSPQVDTDQPEYIEGLKPGDFFNSATGTNFGSVIRIQPIVYFRNFVIWEGAKGQGVFQGTLSVDEFEEMEKEKNLVRDGGDSVDKGAGENGMDIRYTDTRNYAVMLPDHMEQGLLVFAMSSTGIKPSKDWNSQNAIRRFNGQKVARYATIWTLETAGFTKDGYAWKQVAKITPDGWADKSMLQAAAAMLDFAKSVKDSGKVAYSEEHGKSMKDNIEESDF